ncbi:MAG: phosphoribosylglycinamide formyltransferase [Tannerellaceae bacterium]|jgi:phosphoribosylglycinamide formyltransferase-1|nr:phosphoribosylglycinamide formyltransferase [Tannerellaceae bacterium]
MRRIAVFASGAGSNAENIIRYFADSDFIRVALTLSNNPGAGVHARVRALGVPSFTFTAGEFAEAAPVIDKLAEYGADFIVLAGFMNKISWRLTDAFPRSIINIHPALLPMYGGKGMYGMHVHEAVVAAGEKESGITIHYINEHYDEGEIIFQASCRLLPGDTPEKLAERIHALEHAHYPRVIEELLRPLDD